MRRPRDAVIMRPCDVPDDYNVMAQLAVQLSRATILPEHFHDRPDDIMAVMWQAKALDVQLFVALQHCFVVDGTVDESAELQHALARRAGHRLKKVELTDQHAVIAVHLAGEAEPVHVEYTIADAARGELLYKRNWKRSPKAMLWARCVTRAVKENCPEVTLGLWWNDGLGPGLDADGDAEPERLALRSGSPNSAGHGPEIDKVLSKADEIASLEDPDEALVRLQQLWKANTALLRCVAHEDGTLLDAVLEGIAGGIAERMDTEDQSASAAGTRNGTVASPGGVGEQAEAGGRRLACGCLLAEVIATGAHLATCDVGNAP
jgi:hypothetical protein